jgi:hypothetical protein
MCLSKSLKEVLFQVIPMWHSWQTSNVQLSANISTLDLLYFQPQDKICLPKLICHTGYSCLPAEELK